MRDHVQGGFIGPCMLARFLPSSFSLRRCLHGAVNDRRWPGWEVVVGIETHAQIASRHKLFSDSLNSTLGEAPNIHVSPFDAAFPGTLPKVNQECVHLAIRTALALDSALQMRSSFDRKHYFYTDLPSGYQITQHYAPIALGGNIEVRETSRTVRIKQIQLEQDTAKATFDSKTRTSSIDLNRAGTGLLEIVTEPDMRSPEEAGAYVKTLQMILRAIGVSDGNMEAGSLRCDVNVSVNKPGDQPGTRCEIKNLNSVKAMQAAIIWEAKRHVQILDSGGSVPQETRGFNQDTLETFKMRSKEDALDYRYMPDPNLQVLALSQVRLCAFLLLDWAHVLQERVDRIRETMPELPWETRERLLKSYQLTDKDADVLIHLDHGRESAVSYFDQVCSSKSRNPRVVFNWMVHELLGRLYSSKLTFAENPISAAHLGDLVDLIQTGAITGPSGKILIKVMLASPSTQNPTERARELGLMSTGGDIDIEHACRTAILALPSEADAFRRGHQNVLNKIMGRVIKESRGRADAKLVRECLVALLQEGIN
ncbi:unnamed protein product [Mycena citricolor]|uniref:Glutamyl-tRNA(Gln) amidotransferase subunit B, mitochondrial n=1 Tax=Mycena citricolor TaxID=2018698 RepID=A0AAD2Q2T2_9AGAR|nr:unnamed protein product [Mycena citricolor]